MWLIMLNVALLKSRHVKAVAPHLSGKTFSRTINASIKGLRLKVIDSIYIYIYIYIYIFIYIYIYREY